MQESLEPEAGIGEELIEPKAEESRVPGSGRNIYDILYGNIGKKASYPALIYYGRRVTYFQLISAVDSFAAELESRFKIKKGDRIAISLPNSPQFIISFFAIVKIGAVMVPLNTGQNAANFVKKLEILHIKGIVTHSQGYTLLKDAVTEGMFVIVTRVQDFMPFEKASRITFFDSTWGKVKWGGNVYPFSDFMFGSEGSGNPVNPDDDVAIIQLTGVSLPNLQAVSLTHSNIISALRQASDVFTITGKRSIVACATPFSVPYAYLFGFLLPMGTGHPVLVFHDNHDSKTIAKLCRKTGADIMVAHPRIYSKLLFNKKTSKHLKKISIYISGTDTMSGSLASAIVDNLKGKLLQIYGFSETSGISHYRWVDDSGQPANTIGFPFKETSCKIIDQTTGEEVKVGEKGELLVNGPQSARKYLFTLIGEEDNFAGAWFHTGNIVMRNQEGSYILIEKLRDIIISDAIPVFPNEIEAVINKFPEVSESAVIGISDGNLGESIKAFVVTKDGTASCQRKLIKYLNENLAEYQRPHFYEFRNELPKSMSGKIIKRILIEQAAGGADESTGSVK